MHYESIRLITVELCKVIDKIQKERVPENLRENFANYFSFCYLVVFLKEVKINIQN